MNTLELQQHLARLGFDPGTCDGVNGPKTEAALSAFLATCDPTELDVRGVDALVLDAAARFVDGCDASSFQGPMDWARLKLPVARPDLFLPRGLEFAVLRASLGISNDGMFLEHAHEAQAEGIPVIPYHFFYVLSQPPGPQIDALAKQCRLAGVRSATVALDVESTPAGLFGKALEDWFVASREKILDNLRAGVALCVAEFGKKPFIYTYPSYWQELGPSALSPEWSACPSWLSAPTRVGGPHKPIPPWERTLLHQWTDDRSVVVPVDGYGGPHALLDRFAGTIEDLRALT